MTSALISRAVPQRRLPMLAGGGVIGFALPLFLIAPWPVRGWALGAVLWVGSQLLELLFTRIGIAGQPSLRGSGLVAFGMMARGVLIMLVGFVVAASNPALGVAGVLLYAAAYTLEFVVFLALFFSAEAKR